MRTIPPETSLCVLPSAYGQSCTHIIGSVDVTCVVLVEEGHQVEQQVECAVGGLLRRYALRTIPAAGKGMDPLFS